MEYAMNETQVRMYVHRCKSTHASRESRVGAAWALNGWGSTQEEQRGGNRSVQLQH